MSDKEVLQKLFNEAGEKVIAQGRQSIDKSSNTCVYRGPNGIKCAVGHLITDEQIAKYIIRPSSGVELFTITLLEEIAPGVNPSVAVEFLGSLQGCHDGCHFGAGQSFITEFKDRMNVVARRLELQELP